MNDDENRADRYVRRRARTLPVLAIVLVTQQASFLLAPDQAAPDAGFVLAGAWLLMSAGLLLWLATGGGWTLPRRARALVNDRARGRTATGPA